MKFKKHIKKNYKHYICVALLLAFVALSLTVFLNSSGRILEAGRDFGLSVAGLFGFFFDIDGINVTVNNVSEVPLISLGVLAENAEVMKIRLQLYGQMLIKAESLSVYGDWLLSKLTGISYVITFGAPVVLIAWLCGKYIPKKVNNDYNKDTKAVTALKWLIAHSYTPVKKWMQSFIAFVKAHKIYFILWVTVWAYNFNLITIFIEFIAYYLYFIYSSDLWHLYIQLYKLLLDLSVPVRAIPPLLWTIIALVIFDLWRKHVAKKKCEDAEEKDEDFVRGMPLVIMANGTMGCEKTTFITDIALTTQKTYREDALKVMFETDLKFPNFPWINFELCLKKCNRKHVTFNLATYREFCDLLSFGYNQSSKEMSAYVLRYLRRRYGYKYKNFYFDYDVDKYGLYYDDKLTRIDIFGALKTYAQAYYVYTVPCSLIISNYGIRSDEIIEDEGNLPKRDNELLERDSTKINEQSQYSKILDQDALRLGKKVDPDGKYKDAVDIGIIAITEIGKERGNMITNRGQKTDSDEANTSNDYFDYDLKLDRHKSTIAFIPFTRCLTDDQRPESWGADARDTAECFGLSKSSGYKLPSVLFAMDELLYCVGWKWFSDFYEEDRYYKGNNGLARFIFKGLYNAIYQHYIKLFNHYSISKITFKVRDGRLDGEENKQSYYLIKKKIHSDRFATDALAGYYENKFRSSKCGLQDIPAYKCTRATPDELRQQHSYLIQKLDKAFLNAVEDGIEENENDTAESGKLKKGQKK